LKPAADLSLPPWGDPVTWRKINASMHRLVIKYDGALAPAVESAQSILRQLGVLAPLLDGLCRRTCPHCPEPCCLGAKIWYNTADLLVLHLNGLGVPEAQPISGRDDVCRYAGPRGCRLQRSLRPWICTGYLCPPQSAVLRRWGVGRRRDFESCVGEIKGLRAAMEEAFIRVTSGQRGFVLGPEE
jgi:hypothetical protein